MTREQILADTSRAVRECFPDRADAILREIESRFRSEEIVEFKDGKRVELKISASGATAWPERSGWGLAFEFMRAMQRLHEQGLRGDVRVTIVASKD